MDYHGTSRIDMGTTDRDVAETVHRLFRTGTRIVEDRSSKLGKKPIYRVMVYGENARRLMVALYPWMHARRQERIRQVLNAFRSRKNRFGLTKSADLYRSVLGQ